MTDPAAPRAAVLLTPQLGQDQHEPLCEALRSLGYSVTVRTMPPIRADPLTWAVLVSLPVAAFLTTLGSKLAEDAYRAFRAAIGTLLRRDRQSDHGAGSTLVVQDEQTGQRIILDPTLTERAYRQLVDLDLSEFAGGPIRYDHAAGHWTAADGPSS